MLFTVRMPSPESHRTGSHPNQNASQTSARASNVTTESTANLMDNKFITGDTFEATLSFDIVVRAAVSIFENANSLQQISSASSVMPAAVFNAYSSLCEGQRENRTDRRHQMFTWHQSSSFTCTYNSAEYDVAAFFGTPLWNLAAQLIQAEEYLLEAKSASARNCCFSEETIELDGGDTLTGCDAHGSAAERMDAQRPNKVTRIVCSDDYYRAILENDENNVVVSRLRDDTQSPTNVSMSERFNKQGCDKFEISSQSGCRLVCDNRVYLRYCKYTALSVLSKTLEAFLAQRQTAETLNLKVLNPENKSMILSVVNSNPIRFFFAPSSISCSRPHRTSKVLR